MQLQSDLENKMSLSPIGHFPPYLSLKHIDSTFQRICKTPVDMTAEAGLYDLKVLFDQAE